MVVRLRPPGPHGNAAQRSTTPPAPFLASRRMTPANDMRQKRRSRHLSTTWWDCDVKHLPGQDIRAGSRFGESFPYVFKGRARRAGPGWPRLLASAARGMALIRARRRCRQSPGGPFQGTLRAWAPPAALRPSGPRRRRCTSPPRGPPHRLSAMAVSVRRANCKSGPSSRALQRATVKVLSRKWADEGFPSPALGHCLSRPEPVKGAWRRPFGQTLD